MSILIHTTKRLTARQKAEKSKGVLLRDETIGIKENYLSGVMGIGAKFRVSGEKKWCFANVKCSTCTFALETEATGMFTQGVTPPPS